MSTALTANTDTGAADAGTSGDVASSDTGVDTSVADAAAADAPADGDAQEPNSDAAATTDDNPDAAADDSADKDAGDAKDSDADDGDGDQDANAGDYEEFAVIEGVVVNEERMTAFKSVAKELGLDQAGAQKLIDMAAARELEVVAENTAAWQEQRTVWENDSKKDPEFGGAKYDANMVTARKAMDTFGTPELVELFDTYGIGDNPEVIRFAYRIGQNLTEDKLVLGQGASPEQRDTASSWYGKTGEGKG